MNLKRFAALLGSLTVALCLLAGCSDDGNTTPETSETEALTVADTTADTAADTTADTAAGTETPGTLPETAAPDSETTTSETQPPEVTAPETGDSETNAPETDPPETRPQETEPEPETKPEPEPVDPYNVALGQSITSTSTYCYGGSQEYIPQKLVDGIWEGVNGWINDTTNQKSEDGNCDITITITLDTVYTLQELILKPMDAFSGGGFPRAYELALSETGEDGDWTIVATETDKTVASGTVAVSYPLSEKVDAQFIRLHITKTGGNAYLAGDGYYAQLGEIEAWGIDPDATGTVVEVPDPSKVTLTIEDFDDLSPDDVKAVLSPMDLSAFGINPPAYSFNDQWAQTGKGFVNTLNASAWCQAYQITGERLDAFREADDKLYLRVWVATPSGVPISLTVRVQGGSNACFLDATRAVITSVNGEVITCVTGDATTDAGANSSVTIPADFAGYVAFPLDSMKVWTNCAPLSDIKTTDYLRLDIRPSGAVDGDFYVLDELCLTDSTVGRTQQGGGTDGKPAFSDKNTELQYMMDQLLQQEDVIFDYCPEYDPKNYPGIKAMWIQGVPMGGKDTKFFAYIGFPAGASKDDPVPGVVLVHGGAGAAFAEWVKIWNDRGYAAIAMSNVGQAPAVVGMPNTLDLNSWRHYLTAEELAADPRVLTPNNDDMRTSQGKLDRMWMYHAVSQTILCNTLLRSDERVDADRVGVTGISWGGVITSITIGYDDRFAFAIPVYGTGYLHESLGWIKHRFNAPGTAELWEPSLKLKDVEMPILWLGWSNDTPFSINSFDKSFADTSSHAVMTFLQNQGHGYFEGWGPGEIYRFADSVVNGGQPLTTCKTQPQASHNISFEINKPADALRVTARVCYLTEPMSYAPDNDACKIQQTWRFVKATVSGTTITAEIPAEADNYYVEITTTDKSGNKFITVTRYITIAD